MDDLVSMRFLYALFLLTFFSDQDNLKSPNGNFTLRIETEEESDLRVRYKFQLTETKSGKSAEIVNCVRRDLGKPNFYWDKESKFIVVESCSETFKSNEIKIVKLKSFKTDLQVRGLIGNVDSSQEQFDQENKIIIYFDATDDSNFLVLKSLDINIGKTTQLFKFETKFDMEFPMVKRSRVKRELIVEYSDHVTGERFTKQLKY